MSSGEKKHKDFIFYLCDDYKIKPLFIMLLKTSAYVKGYDGETKWMYFLIEDDDILKKYITIWDFDKEFDSETLYNKIFWKTKIKSYGDEVTDFHDNEIPRAGSNHTC